MRMLVMSVLWGQVFWQADFFGECMFIERWWVHVYSVYMFFVCDFIIYWGPGVCMVLLTRHIPGVLCLIMVQ